MSKRGELKKPVVPLRDAYATAMNLISRSPESKRIAIFMIAGKVSASLESSPAFEKRLKQLPNNIVGVYGFEVDHRHVLDDLGEFYKQREAA